MVCGPAVWSFAQTAKITESITLADGDSIVLYDQFISAYESKILPQEQALGEKYYNLGISDPVLRSRGVDKIQGGKEIVIGTFAYYYYNGWPDYLYDELKNVLKIKAARKVVAKMIVKAIGDLCNLYPKDYKESLLKEFNSIRNTLVDMPNHKYELDSIKIEDPGGFQASPPDEADKEYDLHEYYEYYITIDGDYEKYNPNTIDASVIRRILIDKIPREEILGYLDDAIAATLESTPTDDVIYCAKVNNTILYSRSTNGGFYHFISDIRNNKQHSNKSDKRRTFDGHVKIIFYKEDCYHFKYFGGSVLYDSKGNVLYDIRE